MPEQLLYCASGRPRHPPRHLRPDELARSFDLMYRAGLVESLFLSSGVIGTHRTMDEMLATAELVRRNTVSAATCTSSCCPAPGSAPRPRRWQTASRSTWRRRPRGAGRARAAEADRALVAPLRRGRGDHDGAIGCFAGALLGGRRTSTGGCKRAQTTGDARSHLNAVRRRACGRDGPGLLASRRSSIGRSGSPGPTTSTFTPVSDTPLEGEPPTDPQREFRLYQADWLFRYYDFAAEELMFDLHGQPHTDVDPETAWAHAPRAFPGEVNAAPLGELLRVPGIGPKSARAILGARRHGKLREVGDLRKLGTVPTGPHLT